MFIAQSESRDFQGWCTVWKHLSTYSLWRFYRIASVYNSKLKAAIHQQNQFVIINETSVVVFHKVKTIKSKYRFPFPKTTKRQSLNQLKNRDWNFTWLLYWSCTPYTGLGDNDAKKLFYSKQLKATIRTIKVIV